jgi:hypothetical protein
MIAADDGGSNGSRVRLFKIDLQKLADETGLTLQVCHVPPRMALYHRAQTTTMKTLRSARTMLRLSQSGSVEQP